MESQMMSSQSPVSVAALTCYFTLMGSEAMYDMLPSLLSTNACSGKRWLSYNISKTAEPRRVARRMLSVPRRPA